MTWELCALFHFHTGKRVKWVVTLAQHVLNCLCDIFIKQSMSMLLMNDLLLSKIWFVVLEVIQAGLLTLQNHRCKISKFILPESGFNQQSDHEKLKYFPQCFISAHTRHIYFGWSESWVRTSSPRFASSSAVFVPNFWKKTCWFLSFALKSLVWIFLNP